MVKKFEPKEEDYQTVELLTTFGHTQEEICTYLGINNRTLNKYFKKQIEIGRTKTNLSVGKRLYEKAAIDGDVPSMIFWLKTRAGWREKDRENEENQEPVKRVQITVVDKTNYDQDD